MAAASEKEVACANMTTNAIAIAATNVAPPIPNPLVTVRMTGLAMISPTAVASAVGKPTTAARAGEPGSVLTAPERAVSMGPVLTLTGPHGTQHRVRQPE